VRLVSTFHDFYDGCFAFDQDRSVVYLRTPIMYSCKSSDRPNLPPLLSQLAGQFDRLRDGSDTMTWVDKLNAARLPPVLYTDRVRFGLAPVRIIFCGKYVTAIQVTSTPHNTNPSTTKYYYTAQAAVDDLVEAGVLRDRRTTIYRNPVDQITKWFDTNSSRVPDVDWLIANKITCAIWMPDQSITINGCLKDVQFFKYMDTYTTFQELSVWMEGTLAYPQNVMEEISDKYRIKAHGFDEKYGFRTRPKAG
jgi:hypothetical protein